MATAAGVAIALLWTFPPYAVIDDASGGARHAAIGHHPAWRPPTEREAEALLTWRAGPPGPGTPSRSRVMRNDVRLGLETVALALSLAVVGPALTARRRRRAGEAGASAPEATEGAGTP